MILFGFDGFILNSPYMKHFCHQNNRWNRLTLRSNKIHVKHLSSVPFSIEARPGEFSEKYEML